MPACQFDEGFFLFRVSHSRILKKVERRRQRCLTSIPEIAFNLMAHFYFLASTSEIIFASIKQ
jgi:hypothetical protein